MSQIDVKFIKPFIDGTINTLKVQCSVEAKPGTPFVKGTREQPAFQLAGVIGITSEAFTGSINLCFPEAVFLAVMTNMLGEAFTSITDDLQSGAAELLNIIFGSAKIVLNEQGYAIQKAIPTVVRGEGLKATQLGQRPAIVLPFTSSVGEFHIEITLESGAM
jgi:chemotaxis protein CheX